MSESTTKPMLASAAPELQPVDLDEYRDAWKKNFSISMLMAIFFLGLMFVFCPLMILVGFVSDSTNSALTQMYIIFLLEVPLGYGLYYYIRKTMLDYSNYNNALTLVAEENRKRLVRKQSVLLEEAHQRAAERS